MANVMFLFSKNPAWKTDLTFSKDDPLFVSLVERGWDINQAIPVRNARDDERAAWPAERAQALDALIAQLPKAFHFTTQDGVKLTIAEDDIRAQALPRQASKRGLAGHHRAFLMPLANAIRHAQGLPLCEPVTYSVPDDCDDELVAVEHNLRVGQRVMTPAEKMRACISFLIKGSIRTEAQAISTLDLKRTEGQKLFSWACVAKRWPSLDLGSRITDEANPKDPRGIPIRKLMAGAARALLQGAEPSKSGDYTSEAKGVVDVIGPLGAQSPEDVETYLDSLISGVVSGREATRGIPVTTFKNLRLPYAPDSIQARILDALIAADVSAFMKALDSIK